MLGYCSGHPVYPRSCVQTVCSRQRWLREGLQVKENELPAKVRRYGSFKYNLPCSVLKKMIFHHPFVLTRTMSKVQVVKHSRKVNNRLQSLQESDELKVNDSRETLELFGKWQTELLRLPHAKDGIVPKVMFLFYV